MNEFLIHNAKIVRPGISIATGYLHVREGRIFQLGEGSDSPNVDCPFIDAQGQTFTPGLIDMHTHGIRSFHYDQGAEHLHEAACVLGCYGTTTVVPTIVLKLQDGVPKLQDRFLNIHVHPMAVRTAVAAKGWQGVGMDADWVLWRGGIHGLEPGRTWVAGEVVHDARVTG